MGEKLSDHISEEEFEEWAKEVVEDLDYFLEMQAKEEEEQKETYLNKYEVIQLIKELAEASEPMVSAPTYGYYEINAGTVLDELSRLKTYKGMEETD